MQPLACGVTNGRMTQASPATMTFDLPDAAATDALGKWLGQVLGQGDVLLLFGAVGAGKTHVARALIQSLLPQPEDIPSPTFTLVQVYSVPGFDIWHSDLYRLHHPDECLELGLIDAFSTALCLVEWAERLGDLAPPSALHLHLSPQGDGRRAVLSAPPDRLATLAAQRPSHV